MENWRSAGCTRRHQPSPCFKLLRPLLELRRDANKRDRARQVQASPPLISTSGQDERCKCLRFVYTTSSLSAERECADDFKRGVSRCGLTCGLVCGAWSRVARLGIGRRGIPKLSGNSSGTCQDTHVTVKQTLQETAEAILGNWTRLFFPCIRISLCFSTSFALCVEISIRCDTEYKMGSI